MSASVAAEHADHPPAHGHKDDHGHAPPSDQYGTATNGKIAMWLFLVSDAFSFGGLLIAYGILRSGSHTWHHKAGELGWKYATRALYGQFLAGGVRIFEYHRSHLHAKVAVVDERWATVGSSNIDPFSLLLAREANVFVRDPGFASHLQARLELAMASGAREISADAWERGPRLRRILNWAAYGLVRLMIGIAGYGNRH